MLVFFPLSASAALRVGQIHLRGVELSEVAEAVSIYLSGLGADAAEGRARRNLLLVSALPGKAQATKKGPRRGEQGARGGWHLLLDSTPGGVDPRLFAALSRLPGVRLLRTEVDGSTLSWRYLDHRGGGPGEPPSPEESPRPAQGAAPDEGPLPIYQDVELAAWRWLGARQVEAPFRLRGFEAFTAVGEEASPAGAGDSRDRRAIAFDVRVGAAPRRRSLWVRVPSPPATSGPSGPPVSPDTELPEGMGAPGQTIDLIHLSGVPQPGRIRRLSRLLLAIQARTRHALGRPFCHLVEGIYRRPIYTRLAAAAGPCRAVYRTLLAKLLPEAQ